MGNLEKFKLDCRFCKPRSGIDKFFAKTHLKWWDAVDQFTKSVYIYNPTITPQEVLSEYNKGLAEIIAIENINPLVTKHIKSFQKEMIVSFPICYVFLCLLHLLICFQRFISWQKR